MHTTQYFLAALLFLMTTGCTKDFHIDRTQSKPLYVIDGRISNMRGPYYIRITKSDNQLNASTPGNVGLDSAEAVTGALVTMSDDVGLTDTLRLIDAIGLRYDYKYKDGKWDSTLSTDDYYEYKGVRGYYKSTKIAGMPGHTYHLMVRIGSETFEASAYMPPSVPSIDSITLKKDPAADPSGRLGYAAFVSFAEPRDQQNYYMLTVHQTIDYPYDQARGVYYNHWSFPVYTFDDKALPPYVNGMEVLSLISSYTRVGPGRYKPVFFDKDWPSQVRLSALTRETYEYFEAVQQQFIADGNVFKPAPASAVGNISGGALGLFWAPNVSHKEVLPQ